MINTTYIIIPLNELTDSMVEVSLNDVNTIRHNNDNTKVVLKFDTKYPDVMKGYLKYNHQEILEELQEPEWIVED